MVHDQNQEIPDLIHQEIALRTEIKEEADLQTTEIKDHSDPTDHKQKIERIPEVPDRKEDHILQTEEKVEVRMQ
jgi:hypothetical protein